MKFIFLTLLITFSLLYAYAQKGYTCQDAISIPQNNNYCSAVGQYSNADSLQYGTIWFKFTATSTDVSIIVSGNPSGGTIDSAKIYLLADCGQGGIPGATGLTGNITTFYKGGLDIGHQYYIAISSKLKQTGTFKLCFNNFSSPITAGQDCETALFLCNTSPLHQSNVQGAGNKTHESLGTCLRGNESNTFWYKWRAANNGTLVFTITPDDDKDDIDFVLYDLDTVNNCSAVKGVNAIRCAAGHGVDNVGCPNEPIYYKTGLDFNETDVSEASGCGQGQNGKLQYITMQKGHIYGLLINNFTSRNNGFNLSFTDQQGKAGTGLFEAPQATISMQSIDSCEINKTYYISGHGSDYTSFSFDFGSNATVLDVDAGGNYTVKYATAGNKTITVKGESVDGCSVVSSQTLRIPDVVIPPVPAIHINKPLFCSGDTILLSTNATAGVSFHWSGPNQFISTQAKVQIPAGNPATAGTYYLYATLNHCNSTLDSITVPAIMKEPEPAFTAAPALPAKLMAPAVISFTNQSANADAYLWDFGDGTTSADANPIHEYNKSGKYKIKLTAFNSTVCSTSIIEGEFSIYVGNTIFIPNTFTPNNDGINDLFTVTITHIQSYRIQIFNRWGQLVYETKDILRSWDGTHNGNPVPSGTYYYVINAFGEDQNDIKESGYITLIR